METVIGGPPPSRTDYIGYCPAQPSTVDPTRFSDHPGQQEVGLHQPNWLPAPNRASPANGMRVTRPASPALGVERLLGPARSASVRTTANNWPPGWLRAATGFSGLVAILVGQNRDHALQRRQQLKTEHVSPHPVNRPDCSSTSASRLSRPLSICSGVTTLIDRRNWLAPPSPA